jgi:hypothetical protein
LCVAYYHKYMSVNNRVDRVSRRDFLKLAAITATAMSIPRWAHVASDSSIDFKSLLSNEVSAYADAMGFKIDDVLNPERTKQLYFIGTQDSVTFKAIVDTQTNIPLVMTNSKNEWVSASYGELANHGGLWIGAPLDSTIINELKDFNYGFLGSNWIYNQALGPDTFIYDTPHPMQDVPDTIQLKVAAYTGIQDFMLGSIIWAHDRFIPPWLLSRLNEKTTSEEEVFGYIERYARTTIDFFTKTLKTLPGKLPSMRLREVLAVSEAGATQSGDYHDPFLQFFGDFRYIPFTIHIVKDELGKVGSNAEVSFDINDNWESGGSGVQITKDILKVIPQGMIKSVGMQCVPIATSNDWHLDTADMRKMITSYGLEPLLTENLVNINLLNGSDHDRYVAQGLIQNDQLEVLFDAGTHQMIMWGGNDKANHDNELTYNQYNDQKADPTLRDANGNLKPNAYWLRAQLLKRCADPNEMLVNNHRK